jgi:hypothetical protein
MRVLAGHAAVEGHVYFTGGVSALLMKWRTATIDIDIKMVPEQDQLFRALPGLKESLEINVELAAPDQFIPPVPGWEERSPVISRHGRLTFHHYDFYSQALAKIERGHSRDVSDVTAMLDLGLIDPRRTLDYFDQIEPELYRYPAIDPPSFRRAVEERMGGADR